MPNVAYKPRWGKHEKDLHSSSLDKADKAAEAFIEERNLELKTSEKARKYEKSRKEELLKEKPNWVKQKRAQEAAPLQNAIKELKQGGDFDTGFKYIMPGFALVKPVVKTQTDSGLYLNNEVNLNTNTGIIMQTSGAFVGLNSTVEPPFKVGDKVVFRKGLPGLEMSVNNEFCLFMRWNPDPEKTDILAVLEDEDAKS